MGRILDEMNVCVSQASLENLYSIEKQRDVLAATTYAACTGWQSSVNYEETNERLLYYNLGIQKLHPFSPHWVIRMQEV